MFWFIQLKKISIVVLLTLFLAQCSGSGDDDDGGGTQPAETTFYFDADGDGYGDPNKTTETTAAGSVENSTDCDDTNAAINPAATEKISDDIDQNCTGADKFSLTIIAGTYLSDGTTLIRIKTTTYNNGDDITSIVEDLDGDGDTDTTETFTYVNYEDGSYDITTVITNSSGTCLSMEYFLYDSGDNLLAEKSDSNCNGYYDTDISYTNTINPGANSIIEDIIDSDTLISVAFVEKFFLKDDGLEYKEENHTDNFTYTYDSLGAIQTKNRDHDGQDYRYREYDSNGNNTLYKFDSLGRGYYTNKYVMMYDSNNFKTNRELYTMDSSGMETLQRKVVLTNDEFGSTLVETWSDASGAITEIVKNEISYNE